MVRKSVKTIAAELSKHVSDVDGMTNTMVNRLARSFRLKNYKGLYMPSQLEEKRNTVFARTPFSTIVNTGAHFVTIIGYDHAILYLDSNGMPCLEKRTKAFLQSFPNRPVLHNKKRIQGIQSMFCGMYALLFAVYFDKPRSFQMRFKSRPGQRGKANEELCLQYLTRLLNKSEI